MSSYAKEIQRNREVMARCLHLCPKDNIYKKGVYWKYPLTLKVNKDEDLDNILHAVASVVGGYDFVQEINNSDQVLIMSKGYYHYIGS